MKLNPKELATRFWSVMSAVKRRRTESEEVMDVDLIEQVACNSSLYHADAHATCAPFGLNRHGGVLWQCNKHVKTHAGATSPAL